MRDVNPGGIQLREERRGFRAWLDDHRLTASLQSQADLRCRAGSHSAGKNQLARQHVDVVSRLTQSCNDRNVDEIRSTDDVAGWEDADGETASITRTAERCLHDADAAAACDEYPRVPGDDLPERVGIAAVARACRLARAHHTDECSPHLPKTTYLTDRSDESVDELACLDPIERFVDANGEGVLIGCGQHDAARGEAFLKRGRVGPLHAKPKDVRTRWDAVDREPVVRVQPAHQLLGRLYRGAIPIAEAAKVVRGDHRERPDHVEAAAKHAAIVIHAV